MPTLEPPDIHHYSAAIGWLELGNSVEAKIDLEKISTAQRETPAVLEVEWAIYASEKNWPLALQIARKYLAADPGRPSAFLHQAYALRRVSDLRIEGMLFRLLSKRP